MKKNIITNIIIAVVIAGVAFFGGMQYSKSKVMSTTASRQFGGGTSTGMMGGGRPGGASAAMTGMRSGGAVIGSVLSKDDKSITVQTQGGGSKIIFLSEKTAISTAAKGSLADIVAGSDVVVMGTPNADGSVTAQTIQLRPAQ